MKIVRRRRRTGLVISCLVVVILAAAYTVWTLGQPLPDLAPVQSASQLTLQSPSSKLAWPGGDQAAVGLLGTDVLESKGAQTPVPTASTAKLITCLVVLQKHPLGANVAGPIITLTADDVARYNAYVKQDGSVMKIQVGEKINQYQMLQAILLPSANNIADTMAIWAYGSLPAYQEAANAYLAQHGLSGSHVGSDASGLAPDTTSTAHDMVKVGELAMQTPVLSQIVNQSTATGIPIVNNIKNVNSLLGTAGIVGIKTGNSDHAGGTFVGAARVVVNDKQQTVITAVMNAPNLAAAMKDSLSLIQSAQANFEPVTVIKQGAIVGSYRQAWGGSIDAVADQDLAPLAWDGAPVTASVKLSLTPAESRAGDTVGQLTSPLTKQYVALKLKTAPTVPSIWWRLLHPKI